MHRLVTACTQALANRAVSSASSCHLHQRVAAQGSSPLPFVAQLPRGRGSHQTLRFQFPPGGPRASLLLSAGRAITSATSAANSDDPANGSESDEEDDQQPLPEEDDSQDADSVRVDADTVRNKESSRQETTSVASLLFDIDRGAIITQPFFQRGYVWSHTHASRVIETLLLRNPLPEVIIYESLMQIEKDGEKDEKKVRLVVDGQQRLTSIVNFVNNKRAKNKGWSNSAKEKDKGFYLKGLQYRPEFNDKRFQELKMTSQDMIKDAPITMKIIPASWTMDELLVYFVAIQAGGVNMKAAELILAMNHGPFTELLEELALRKEVRDIWPDPKSRPKPKEAREQELLMRFFAAHRVGHEEYGSGSMSMVALQQKVARDLNERLREERKAGSDALEKELTEALVDFLTLAHEIWAPSEAGWQCPGPFRKAAKDSGAGIRWAAKNPALTVDKNVFDFEMYICSLGCSVYNRERLLEHKDRIYDMSIDLMRSDPAFQSLRHAGHCERIRRCREEMAEIMTGEAAS